MLSCIASVITAVSLLVVGTLTLVLMLWWLLHRFMPEHMPLMIKCKSSPPQGYTLRQLVEAAETAAKRRKSIWTKVHMKGYLVTVGNLVRSQFGEHSLLGVGAYSAVYGVHLLDVPFPICFKKLEVGSLKILLRECDNLERLKGVDGLPRMLAVSVDPLGFFMTQHGDRTTTMASWRKGLTRPSEALVVGAIYRLCTILSNVHRLRLCHNDIKLNNVAVEVGPGGRVEVTLLDLGLMRPYGCFPWGFMRTRNFNKPLKPFYDPELIKGEVPCSEKTEVYAVGYLVQCLLPILSVTRKQMMYCSLLAMSSVADHRPTLKELVVHTNHVLLSLLPDMLPPTPSIPFPSVHLEGLPSSLCGHRKTDRNDDQISGSVE